MKPTPVSIKEIITWALLIAGFAGVYVGKPFEAGRQFESVMRRLDKMEIDQLELKHKMDVNTADHTLIQVSLGRIEERFRLK